MLVYIALFIVIILWITEHKRYRWFYILAKTFRRDYKALRILYTLNSYLRKCTKENQTLKTLFESVAKIQPDKVAFYFEDETWSYSKVDEFSNQVARYFISEGFKRGDTIALMLGSCPEYPCIYLGLSTFGGVTSLINTNLVKDALLLSISNTQCKAVIYGSNLSQSIPDVSDKLIGMKLYQLQDRNDKQDLLPGAVDLRIELAKTSGKKVELESVEGCANDPLVFIFTSGTTGLPKASVITNVRCLMMSKGISLSAELGPDDIIYNPLPLYHVAGSMIGVGQALVCGHSVVIKKKFSAANYFKDCAKYNATAAQYIGEMCRYLLAASEENPPVKHDVKTILGNGLNPQLWQPFLDTFNIKNAVEFYGATEGISNLVNMDNRIGAVGFVPRYLQRLWPVILIKCDEISGEPFRDSNGRCVECNVFEPGLAIGKIKRGAPIFNFQGYTNKGATEKKIIRDVFKNGDCFFNSGDILVYDEFGYFYFKDRTGDTFRWKGENVSTNEIEAIINKLVKLNDVIVYGVEIPNTDGKAGMAAIVDSDKSLDIEGLGPKLKDSLPRYAIPIFVRVLESIPMTGTFKLMKYQLKDEGYNVEKVKDDMYFFDAQANNYVSLTQELYEQVIGGLIRL